MVPSSMARRGGQRAHFRNQVVDEGVERGRVDRGTNDVHVGHGAGRG